MYVADQTVIVAIISAAAGVGGALASPVAIAFRESRQAVRDRADRQVAGRQQAYLELLGTAGRLRTEVASYYEHKGSGLHDRLAEVRELAATTGLNAVRVRFLAPGPIGELAENLAAAANGLAERAISDTDLSLDAVSREDGPDYEPLDKCLETFRQAVAVGEEGEGTVSRRRARRAIR